MDAEEKAAVPFCNEAANSSVNTLNIPSNRRAHPRYAVDEVSTLLLVSHGLSLESHILDLSLEGCRLRTQAPYTAGTYARVEVTFKVNGIAFRCVGIIQWTDGLHLVGIRFVEMISRRSEELVEVMCEMEAAASAAKEAAERVSAESEIAEAAQAQVENEAQEEARQHAQELAEIEARSLVEREEREWAEIQEIARKTKAAHEARALQLQHEAQTKRDRRAWRRHEVDTSATILLVKSGSTLRGHIADLSASGCRIRCNERFPVGIFTRIEMEFQLEGLPFRLGGVIQTIHDLRTVGIRFLDLSRRKQEQLDQLIAEIEEARAEPPVVVEQLMEGKGRLRPVPSDPAAESK
jgi:hypothetical protein